MMSNFKRMSSTALAGVFLAFWGGAAAQAQTITSNFAVRITVQGTCAVLTATDIDFGTQISGAGMHDQTGTISVQCTKDLPFTLGLDGGTTTGTVTARAMVGPTSVQIPYALTKDSHAGANWGNDSGSWFSGVGLGLGSGFALTQTVYARATLTGTEPAGAYTDTVTATLTY